MAHDGHEVEVTLTREEFETLTRSLLDRTIELTRQAVEAAKQRGVEKIDRVLLVGGSSRMPAVAARLSEELGVPTQLADPDLAVAKGAAVYGQKKAIERLVVRDLVTRGQLRDGAPVGSASPADSTRLRPARAAFEMTTEQVRRTVEIEVLNVCSRGFGVLAIGLTDLEAVFLVHRNDRLPVAVRRSFGTVRDDQETVTVRVVEQGGGVESTDPLREQDHRRGVDHRDPARLPGRQPGRDHAGDGLRRDPGADGPARAWATGRCASRSRRARR